MDNQQLLQHSKKWDRTGLVVATLCILHCLSFPVLIALLPSARLFLESQWLEAAILLAGISIGGFSFLLSFRQHRQKYPIILGLMGVTLLTISLFFSTSIHVHSSQLWHSLDPLMVGGGLLLIAGHFGNIHACHCFCDKSCSHDSHPHPPKA
jgi:hypothetical protein